MQFFWANIVINLAHIANYYLESREMNFTFVREINFKNFMDDDPANILI